MNPLFSIIIPIHNCEPYLRACINSIQTQQFENYELILVNDGSSDGSGTICKEYANTNNKVHYYELEWGGVSKARNFGVEHACGDYILFIDADDLLLSGALMIYVDVINKSSADIIKCGYETVLTDGTVLKSVISSPIEINEGNTLEMLRATEASDYCGYLWNTAFKKEAIGSVRFDETLSLNEDHVFSRHCFKNCDSMYLENKIVYRYIKRERMSLAMTRDPITLAKSAIIEADSKLDIINGQDSTLIKKSNHLLYVRLCRSLYLLRVVQDKRKTAKELFRVISSGIKDKPFGYIHLFSSFFLLTIESIFKRKNIAR